MITSSAGEVKVDDSPIRSLRRKAGWSQSQLAAFCRLRSTATISALEAGLLGELPTRVKAGLVRLSVDVESIATAQRTFAAERHREAAASAQQALRDVPPRD